MKKSDTIKSLVMRSMVMRLTERESLDYLKEEGYEISRRQFYRYKKNIYDSRFDRLSEIAKGFVDFQMERLATLELINHEMWVSYRNGNYKAMDALSKIAEIQPIVSSFFDASKLVMEDEIERVRKETQYEEWKRHKKYAKSEIESESWANDEEPPIE